MLPQFCIRRPIFATVLSLLIVIAGLVAVRSLPVAQYPEIAPPAVSIYASYPGADAQTLARTVAAPIEDQLSGIEGLLYFDTSLRSNGDVRILATFEVGTNADDATVEINNRVRAAERRLPDEVRRNGISVRKRTNDVLMMAALYSPDRSRSALEIADYARLNIADELKRVPGIGDVGVFGNAESAMRIWLKPDRMAQLGVTVDEVRAAIDAQNRQYAAGKVGGAPTGAQQELTYTVTTRGQLLTPEQFGAIVVRSRGREGVLHLRDIARIEIGARNYEAYNELSLEPSVTLGIYLQTGANAMAAAQGIKSRLAELARDFPEGISYTITDDTTVFVEASLKEVGRTLAEAALLVLLVVYVFLQSWRATLIPMLAVPVSLIGTLAGLWLFGFSLNTLTLFAMTLAIGIVVDDAIVVLENVERLIRTRGLSPRQAAQEAMREVSGALVAIVLVLCAVFVPVAFLGGMAGELYRQFAVTVAVAVALSGFVALTLTPALCALLLKPQHGEPARAFRAFNSGFERFTGLYTKGVGLALAHRGISALVFVAVCTGAWALTKTLPTSFVPREDMGLLRASLNLPEGASLVRTGEAGREFQQAILAIDGVSSVLMLAGNDIVGGDTKPNAATFIIPLKPWDERQLSAEEIRTRIQAAGRQLGDGVTVAFNPAPIRGLGSSGGFEAYLQARGSDDPRLMQQAMDGLLEALGRAPELTGVRGFLRADSPQLRLEVDEDQALAMQVELADVYGTLSTLLGGSYINDFSRNGRSYRVMLQADLDYRMRPEDLGRFWVRSAEGKMLPLASLIRIERVAGPESLARLNGFLSAKFVGSAVQGVSSGRAIEVVEQIARETLPEGYQVEWTGQAFHEKRIGASSATAFGFALLIVFLILAAQYERWSLPIAVLMAVPYAILGALVAIWVRGFPNDIYFQIGLLVLIGLAAKNAILIVEFAAQRLEAGSSVFEAALEAARLRLRPIVMTSLAFVLGVVPLVWATGAGAAARQSMGTGVFGGMLAATFVATLFVPVFFTWFVARHRQGASGSRSA